MIIVVQQQRLNVATKVRQSDVAKAKLVDATIALIAERGLLGFSLADVGTRAGVSRGLAGYHFKTSQALLLAALARLGGDEADDRGRGIKPMLQWVQAQVQLAAMGDLRVQAMLQLAFGPGADGEVLKLREAYRRRQTDLLQRHLSSARAAHQILQTLDLAETAAIVLGLMHGEQLRVMAAGERPGGGFIALLERALAAPTPKAERKKPGPQPTSGQQVLL